MNVEKNYLNPEIKKIMITDPVRPLQKPRLRGFLHQEAFFVSLGACALLVLRSTHSESLIASLIYSLGLLLLFGVSAIYHRPYWKPQARALLKRLDHSAIFIFIAGTGTPIALLALPAPQGKNFLILIWAMALLGLLQSIFWVKAPKWVTALLYIGMGWLAYPYLPLMKNTLSSTSIGLLIAGGVAYTVGAIFYALKKPSLWAATFGYHELFHFLTIIAAGLHFSVIYTLIH